MKTASRPATSVIYSVLSALLDYPEPSTQDALPEARALLHAARAFPPHVRTGLERFIDDYGQRDLMTLQERYVALFDRGRATSLYLFEHVHGESRDRGQAMVDLLHMYEQHGLWLRQGELPDYLPVFLEYLSRLPESEACKLLAETGDILQAITTRLSERGSRYRFVVAALLSLAGLHVDVLPDHASTDDEADAPPSPADFRALDAAYADEAVRFVGAQVPVTEPVHFYDRRPGRDR
ncbi:Nitrate reductase molybdenum cofactor assembly chaperone NarJ [Ralstonia condita]|jgi:nitrate reductase delta subunit|uniref:Nitrate reductase molybdenum cofactor assembly chaperone NarJ n=1 Tax=Ralstonia condita TaxID=3058600 RepID=A0ABM9J5E0_9RALS|nr:nitrate reductase molybdenum cofactor assembly chaperone [Ralstonia sp. LMG 7141]MDE2203016.1 nitrate reductase molybdenum cofactor assembly chaperone [Burkholderiaceae bacterium]CAJ0783079.1 Nitrate reductase molybdenum cofactor assembly chaperone NarJ [Ralstonia sp. LMG 7141]